MILYQPNWFTKIVFSWKLWVLWSWFWRQNDRKTILYNPPFDGAVHRARFHNFISSFIKEGCFLAVFVVGFLGFLVPMVAWGIKIVCKKFDEFLTKIDIFLQKMVKWFFIIFLLNCRAEEEKLKLMLQLDEVQLRLKSAEFSKPATWRIRKLNNETGWFCLKFSFIL